MHAGRQPVELAPEQHGGVPRAARLGLVGDFLDLPFLQLRKFLLVPARFAYHGAEQVDRLVEVRLRDGE